jgi:hypothetical protein
MTQQNLGGQGAPQPPPLPAPYDPSQDQETARRRIAYGLCALIAIVVGFGLIALLFTSVALDRIERLSLFVGPLFGIAGTVLGFYFSQRR